MFKDTEGSRLSGIPSLPGQTKLEYAGLKLHYYPGESYISAGRSSRDLNPNEAIILKCLISNPEHFVPRDSLVELLYTNNPKKVNYSEGLRKHVSFLRSKVNGLYAIPKQVAPEPQLFIHYRKQLGYILTQNKILGEALKKIDSKLTFVELSPRDEPEMKIYEGLMFDPIKGAAYALHDESTYARVGLTPAQYEILRVLIEKPEKMVTYEEMFELEIGHSAEEHEDDFGYGSSELGYPQRRKRLGDNVTLLRKSLIDLYRFTERKKGSFPLPITVKDAGYMLSAKHRFYGRIFRTEQLRDE